MSQNWRVPSLRIISYGLVYTDGYETYEDTTQRSKRSSQWNCKYFYSTSLFCRLNYVLNNKIFWYVLYVYIYSVHSEFWGGETTRPLHHIIILCHGRRISRHNICMRKHNCFGVFLEITLSSVLGTHWQIPSIAIPWAWHCVLWENTLLSDLFSNGHGSFSHIIFAPHYGKIRGHVDSLFEGVEFQPRLDKIWYQI